MTAVAALSNDFEAWPDPESIPLKTIAGVRHYATPDGVYPSVTTILKVLGLSTNALVAWSAGREREAILEAVGDVYAEWDGGGPNDFVAAVEARIGKAKQHQTLLAKAADIGTSIHHSIQWKLRQEMGLPNGPKPAIVPQAAVALTAWEDWWRGARLRPIRIEQPLWDAEIGYAGTADLIAEGPEGLELWDWKSGKGIYAEYHMQIAAYCHAARRWGWIKRGGIVRLPKTVEDTSIEVKEMGDCYDRRLTEEELLAAFRAAKIAWDVLVRKEAV